MQKVSIIAQFKKKKPTDPSGSIIIRGFYNRKPVASISTGYKVKESDWDPEKRMAVNNSPNAKLVNSCIEMKILDMRRQLMQKEIAGHSINRVQVQKAIKGIDETRDFMAFCRRRIREDYTNPDTRRSYLTECDNLERFRTHISFADIDYNFLNSYNNHLKKELLNDRNTIWKKMKFIRTMINKAIKSGEATHNPFIEYKMPGYTQKPRNYLQLEDCEKIEREIIQKPQPDIMQRVATYFLLMAYTGMRFRDAINFRPKEHVKNGHIVMRYQKADTHVNNWIHRRLAGIIKLVEKHPFTCTNKTMNQYLKVIQVLCGIEIKLTTHLGRHTLGALLAQLRVPESEAQIILGHKDRRSTRVYYHIDQKSINESLQKIDLL